jgi:hypothetical protein
MFFDFYLARNIWRIIYFVLHIERPNSINHIIMNWAANKGTAHRKKLLIGVATMFWSIWLCAHTDSDSEDCCRKKKLTTRFLRYVNPLEMVAMEIFAKHGWRSNARLDGA